MHLIVADTAALKCTIQNPGHCYQDAAVFQQMQYPLHEMCNVTLTAFVNTGYPQTVQISANEDAKMAAVE